MKLLKAVLLQEDIRKDWIPQLGGHTIDHLQLVQSWLPNLVVFKVGEVSRLHLLDYFLALAIEEVGAKTRLVLFFEAVSCLESVAFISRQNIFDSWQFFHKVISCKV